MSMASPFDAAWLFLKQWEDLPEDWGKEPQDPERSPWESVDWDEPDPEGMVRVPPHLPEHSGFSPRQPRHPALIDILRLERQQRIEAMKRRSAGGDMAGSGAGASA
jgi:hypothetical protein